MPGSAAQVGARGTLSNAFRKIILGERPRGGGRRLEKTNKGKIHEGNKYSITEKRRN